MNIKTILQEIKSPGIRELIKDLDDIVLKVRNGTITYQQGNMEVVGRKHIIQSIALDWAFNGKKYIKEVEK